MKYRQRIGQQDVVGIDEEDVVARYMGNSSVAATCRTWATVRLVDVAESGVRFREAGGDEPASVARIVVAENALEISEGLARDRLEAVSKIPFHVVDTDDHGNLGRHQTIVLGECRAVGLPAVPSAAPETNDCGYSTFATIARVGAFVTPTGIEIDAAVKLVVTFVTEENVIARVTRKPVVAPVPVQSVVAAAAAEQVISLVSVESIIICHARSA